MNIPYPVTNGVARILGQMIEGYYSKNLPVVALDECLSDELATTEELMYLACPELAARLLKASPDLKPEISARIMKQIPPAAPGFKTFSFSKHDHGWKCHRPSGQFGLVVGTVAPDGLSLCQAADFVEEVLRQGDESSFYRRSNLWPSGMICFYSSDRQTTLNLSAYLTDRGELRFCTESNIMNGGLGLSLETMRLVIPICQAFEGAIGMTAEELATDLIVAAKEAGIRANKPRIYRRDNRLLLCLFHDNAVQFLSEKLHEKQSVPSQG